VLGRQRVGFLSMDYIARYPVAKNKTKQNPLKKRKREKN
jgi:hypothetical protein